MPKIIQTDTDCAIGAALREARRRAGLSQSAIGEALGVSFQQIQKYEKGTNRIAAAQLVALAEALNVPAAALLPGAAPETQSVDCSAEDMAPCPFCGSHDLTCHDTEVFWVRCEACGAEGPGEEDKKASIRRWNVGARRNADVAAIAALTGILTEESGAAYGLMDEDERRGVRAYNRLVRHAIDAIQHDSSRVLAEADNG
ncbi:Lar family restriction alleviation protein [Afifella sp. H1R]|uniref:Lar family restriction alleviation protein n=1 Tax=Afifella sp. H1R TaxID=2908841 RepID=UPI001F19B5B2|nr:Lar family restriction alleviation protein [Afifella sp. H1R]MCF1502955.1 Lar family restriction alleviation protein [Afifella sp. H1R]